MCEIFVGFSIIERIISLAMWKMILELRDFVDLDHILMRYFFYRTILKSLNNSKFREKRFSGQFSIDIAKKIWP